MFLFSDAENCNGVSQYKLHHFGVLGNLMTFNHVKMLVACHVLHVNDM